MEVKKKLFELCKAYVNKRSHTVEHIMFSNKKALENETKSSAGDKHETGRAMLQLEMEKASQQLSGIHLMKETLAKIDIISTSDIVRLGSVIKTEKVNYFLSVSAGQLVVENEHYFAISVSSPIGKRLLGKKKNDEILFNGNKMLVKEIF